MAEKKRLLANPATIALEAFALLSFVGVFGLVIAAIAAGLPMLYLAAVLTLLLGAALYWKALEVRKKLIAKKRAEGVELSKAEASVTQPPLKAEEAAAPADPEANTSVIETPRS